MRGLSARRSAKQFAGDFLVGVAVFLTVMALACFDHQEALSAPSFQLNAKNGSQHTTITPANAPSGSLFIAPHTPSDTTPVKQIKHLDSNVEVRITGPLAHVLVTQNFVNNTKINGRGVFAFPLPDTATINALTITAGERRMEGRIVRYDGAAQMQQLLTSAGFPVSLDAATSSGTPVISIDRVDAGEHVTVRFEYVQRLASSSGPQRFEFPLMRYEGTHASRMHTANLEAAAQRGGNSDPTSPVSMRIWLNTGFSLGKVVSPTHAIAVRKASDGSAMLSLAHARIRTDRNFVLTWEVQTPDAVNVAAFKETTANSTHLVAMLKTGETATASNQARELILVADTSGSMKGHSLNQLKKGLAAALSGLGPRDRFNVIHFNSQSEMLFEKAQPLTSQSLGIALNYVAGLEAIGGTEALPALDAALVDADQKTQGIRQIVFLTDGEIEGAAEFLGRIAERRGRSRLFTVGIGPDISPSVMRRAAEIGRGKFIHIENRSRVSDGLERFFATLARPVVTDLRIDWPNGVRADTWPNPLPDLYAGKPLLISSELSGLKGDLKLSGTYDGNPWSQSLPLANASEGQGISTFWARNKLASLDARKYAGQSQADVNAAIEALAMKHSIPSKRTALVGFSVISLDQAQPMASEDLPVEWPSAWVQDGISRPASNETPGESGHGSILSKEQTTAPLITSSILKPSAQGHLPAEIKIASRAGGFVQALGNQGVGTSETAGQNWTLTIMALIFSLMTAVTIGLWRHLRRAVSPTRRERRIRLGR